MSASETMSGSNPRFDDNPKNMADETKSLRKDLKDQANTLASNAGAAIQNQADSLVNQAKEIASEAGEKVQASIKEQKSAGADYVGNVAGIVRRAAAEFDNDLPQAGQFFRKAAEQLENVSDAIGKRDVSEIVGSVQDFARKQPTIFLGASVLLGFAAIRLLKTASPQNSSLENQSHEGSVG
jgi:ElaB/YqjD/DUF883 family membrane-anchored ribosome-binding protein